jgi:hypothetical protein
MKDFRIGSLDSMHSQLELPEVYSYDWDFFDNI